MVMLLLEYMNVQRADLNTLRASSKHIQSKNDNLNNLEPKHKNFKDQYKIKERVFKKL
jgi:hypothetical protein